jgi:hypothetical protein
VVSAALDADLSADCGLASRVPDTDAPFKKQAAVTAIKVRCFIICLIKKFIVENQIRQSNLKECLAASDTFVLNRQLALIGLQNLEGS